MTEFHIKDELFEDHVVNEHEFKETLNGLKELWDEEYEMDVHRDIEEGTITQTWIFASVTLWVIASDYEELKELRLCLKKKI